MRKLGCVSSPLLGNSDIENANLIKQVGFNTTFIGWQGESHAQEFVDNARRIGLEVETIHNRFDRMNEMWSNDECGDQYTEILRECIVVAGQLEIPYVIMHTSIGSFPPQASNIGMRRFEKLVIAAQKHNVKLAFENLEFYRHVGLILEAFKCDNVGFCYDIGHESCYTPGFKCLPMFGERLFCTHIHDNLGVGETKDIDYRDDLHRIPFDGNIDYSSVCKGISQCGYKGSLMLEISNREPYCFYNGYTAEQYYSRAFEAAKRLRAMTDGGAI